jgi:hypothetical protein
MDLDRGKDLSLLLIDRTQIAKCRFRLCSKICISEASDLSQKASNPTMLHQVLDVETGQYLGDVNSPCGLHLEDGIGHYDGRVFRVRSLKTTKEGSEQRRRIEVVETADRTWSVPLVRPAS